MILQIFHTWFVRPEALHCPMWRQQAYKFLFLFSSQSHRLHTDSGFTVVSGRCNSDKMQPNYIYSTIRSVYLSLPSMVKYGKTEKGSPKTYDPFITVEIPGDSFKSRSSEMPEYHAGDLWTASNPG